MIKPLLAVAGESMLHRVLRAVSDADHIVVVGPAELAGHLPAGVRLTQEQPAGTGPVAGIAAGLNALQHLANPPSTSADRATEAVPAPTRPPPTSAAHGPAAHGPTAHGPTAHGPTAHAQVAHVGAEPAERAEGQAERAEGQAERAEGQAEREARAKGPDEQAASAPPSAAQTAPSNPHQTPPNERAPIQTDGSNAPTGLAQAAGSGHAAGSAHAAGSGHAAGSAHAAGSGHAEGSGQDGEYVAVVGGDLPFLSASALALLRQNTRDVAVYVDDEGRRQPMVAVWTVKALIRALASVPPSMKVLVGNAARVAEVRWPGEGGAIPAWYDCDTPEELERAEGWLA